LSTTASSTISSQKENDVAENFRAASTGFLFDISTLPTIKPSTLKFDKSTERFFTTQKPFTAFDETEGISNLEETDPHFFNFGIVKNVRKNKTILMLAPKKI
jgi:hypothetical protein